MGEPSLFSPDLIYKTLEKVHIIRIWLQLAFRRKKSYADHKRRTLEFEEGDKVYLKISPMKGVVRFCKKEKFSTHYVVPYQILKRVGKVAYELNLSSELASVNSILHVSMLRKCISYRESILPLEGLGVKDNISYEEIPVKILDRQLKKFTNK